MDNSPLSRLPLELREQILDYLMPVDIKHITSCMKQNASISSLDPVKDMAIALARRYAFVASCHELQRLCLRLDLRRTEFIWGCFLPLSSSPVHRDIQIQDDNLDAVFHALPVLRSQGFIDSVRGVGAVVSDDYLHRESWNMNGASGAQRQANWINEPLEILSMYERVIHIACRLRTEQCQRGLGHHQIFYRHSYRLQAFTDGNAARPIKKALRKTWRRDTIEITIDMLSEAISLQRMREAISLLDVEHLEKMEAIQIEIDRQVPLSSVSSSAALDRERSIYVQFLHDMDIKYSRWRQRIKKFHEGLIKVVMLGYRSGYHDVENHMEGLRAVLEQAAPQDCTGDQVVDTVLDMIKATKLHDIGPSQHTKPN
ncbi:hypothetical protein KCU95_g16459, partial [Aureobasidium melanogenum]